MCLRDSYPSWIMRLPLPIYRVVEIRRKAVFAENLGERVSEVLLKIAGTDHPLAFHPRDRLRVVDAIRKV